MKTKLLTKLLFLVALVSAGALPLMGIDTDASADVPAATETVDSSTDSSGSDEVTSPSEDVGATDAAGTTNADPTIHTFFVERVGGSDYYINQSGTSVKLEDKTTYSDGFFKYAKDGSTTKFNPASISSDAVVYNGITYSYSVKFESTTEITFTTSGEADFLIVAAKNSKSDKISIDGTSRTLAQSENTEDINALVYSAKLGAGSHSIKRDGESHVVYIEVIETPSTFQLKSPTIVYDESAGTITISADADDAANLGGITYSIDGGDAVTVNKPEGGVLVLNLADLNLAYGNHTITVTANAKGGTDYENSEAATYEFTLGSTEFETHTLTYADQTDKYFTLTNTSNTDKKVTYKSTDYNSYISLNKTTSTITFTCKENAHLLIVGPTDKNGSNSIYIDDIVKQFTKITNETGVMNNACVIELDIPAGTHTIKRKTNTTMGISLLRVVEDPNLQVATKAIAPILSQTHRDYKDDGLAPISNYAEIKAAAGNGFDHVEYSYDNKNWFPVTEVVNDNGEIEVKVFIYGLDDDGNEITDTTKAKTFAAGCTDASYDVYLRTVFVKDYPTTADSDTSAKKYTYPGVPSYTLEEELDSDGNITGNLVLNASHVVSDAQIEYLTRSEANWSNSEIYDSSDKPEIVPGVIRVCVKATVDGVTSVQVYQTPTFPQDNRISLPVVTFNEANATFSIAISGDDPYLSSVKNIVFKTTTTYDEEGNPVFDQGEGYIYSRSVKIPLPENAKAGDVVKFSVRAMALSSSEGIENSRAAVVDGNFTIKRQWTPMISITELGIVRINPPRSSSNKLEAYPDRTVLKYTLDGSDPLTSPTAKVYDTEFEVLDGVTIKAAAVGQGFYLDSNVAENYWTDESESEAYYWWVQGPTDFHDPLGMYDEANSFTRLNNGTSNFADKSFGYVYVLKDEAAAGGNFRFTTTSASSENTTGSIMTVVQAITREASNGNVPALGRQNSEGAWEFVGNFDELGGTFVDYESDGVRVWTIPLPEPGTYTIAKQTAVAKEDVPDRTVDNRTPANATANNEGQSGIVLVRVKYSATGAQLNTPTITIDHIDDSGMAAVRISCMDATHIFYTTDGTDPVIPDAITDAEGNYILDENGWIQFEFPEGSTTKLPGIQTDDKLGALVEHVENGATIKAVGWCSNVFYTQSEIATQKIYTDKILTAPVVRQLNGSFAIDYVGATKGVSIEYSLDGKLGSTYTLPQTVLSDAILRARAVATNATPSVTEVEITAAPKKAYDTRSYLGVGAFDINLLSVDENGYPALDALDDKEYPGTRLTLMTTDGARISEAYVDNSLTGEALTKSGNRLPIYCMATETGTNTEGQRRSMTSPSGVQVKISRADKNISRVLLYTVLYNPESTKSKPNGLDGDDKAYAYDASKVTYVSEMCGRTYAAPAISQYAAPAADAQPNAIELLSCDPRNPDLRIFDVTDENGNGIGEVTFTITGQQVAYVVVLEEGDGEPLISDSHCPPTITFEDWQVKMSIKEVYGEHIAHDIRYTINDDFDSALTDVTNTNVHSISFSDAAEILEGKLVTGLEGVLPDGTGAISLVSYGPTTFKAATTGLDEKGNTTISRVVTANWELRPTPYINVNKDGVVTVQCQDKRLIAYKIFDADHEDLKKEVIFPGTAKTINEKGMLDWYYLYDEAGNASAAPILTNGQTIVVKALGDGTNYGHSGEARLTYNASVLPPYITFTENKGEYTANTTLEPEAGTPEKAYISYTTDGTDPRTSRSARVYSEPFVVDNGTLVRAITCLYNETTESTLKSGISEKAFIASTGSFVQWWMENDHGETDNKTVFSNWQTIADPLYGPCNYSIYDDKLGSWAVKGFSFGNRMDDKGGMVLVNTKAGKTGYSKVTVVQSLRKNADALPALYQDFTEGYKYQYPINEGYRFNSVVDSVQQVRISTFYLEEGSYRIGFDQKQAGDEAAGVVYIGVATTPTPPAAYIRYEDGSYERLNSYTDDIGNLAWTLTLPEGIGRPWQIVYGREITTDGNTTLSGTVFGQIEQLVDHYNNDVWNPQTNHALATELDVDTKENFDYRSDTETTIIFTYVEGSDTQDIASKLYITRANLVDIYLDVAHSPGVAVESLGWHTKGGYDSLDDYAPNAQPYVKYWNESDSHFTENLTNVLPMHKAGKGGIHNDFTDKDVPGLYEIALPSDATHIRFSHKNIEGTHIPVYNAINNAPARKNANANVQGGEVNEQGGVKVYKGKVYTINADGSISYADPDPNDHTTGVESVEADNQASAIYFNLQGIRVRNPQPGNFYIVTRNGISTKEVY